ncbi:cytochrome c oxidase assembly protein subunit 15 [Limimonas halophila]|uniref:Heme A synthase n=1 Tax=Limimonas halophila TaxID=1082479 RepID=A0A1G7RA01_9PROT|nr:COX15/CtaA family protein [Limimonas halophila]SDG07636.1 cytochrome c oxidase assembly protein subunit 15 [Limimonas halophila]
MSTLTFAGQSAARRADDRAVGAWLLAVCGMIFAMAVIGAITRLTESGLSIMEWAPVSGVLPPMSQAEWERIFALYKQTAEYRELNAGMSLAEFKTIFWWEWVHRLWGRLIGAVFLAGFLWLLLRGKLRRGLTPHLIALFVLGGLQGALGWFMVASGFAERTDVSQYRLTLHLGFALAIYAYALALAIRLRWPSAPASADAAGVRRGLWAFAGLVAVTIVAGALVAGLNAGMSYNTYPLMAGEVVPANYGVHAPWWLNWFENVAAVQFNHRLLAHLTVVAGLALWVWGCFARLSEEARRALAWLALGSLGQLVLGVVTLLAVVPVWLGAAHQAGAIVVLSLTIWALSRVRAPGVGAAGV